MSKSNRERIDRVKSSNLISDKYKDQFEKDVETYIKDIEVNAFEEVKALKKNAYDNLCNNGICFY